MRINPSLRKYSTFTKTQDQRKHLSNYRLNNKNIFKTQKASLETTLTQSREKIFNLKQLTSLFDEKSKQPKKIKMFPEDYGNLFERKNIPKKNIPKCSKQGHPSRSFYRVDVMNAKHQQMQKSLEKQNIYAVSKDILKLFDDARKLNISQEKIIEFIEKSEMSHILTKVLFKKTKFHNVKCMIQTVQQLIQKIKYTYMTSSNNMYLVLYLKTFKQNFQNQVQQWNINRMRAIDSCVEDWKKRVNTLNNKQNQCSSQKRTQKTHKIHSQNIRQKIKSRVNSRQQMKPRRLFSCKSPCKSFSLFNKLNLGELSGDFLHISSFIQENTRQLDRVNYLVKQCSFTK